ncbi:cytidine deaminase-like protein [Pisolithus orientalis]|uniref:cytidine deaminase-like protein n=1 Tax=Pisolithus orientalis TaxID=936130 RepID=UPI002224B35B|nr:cytidine deaminase-like protein [Pisolithus orientalis]KAI6004995.1 cytidine deaminase-like protein [Pisolithus orientalis]
MMHLVLDSSDAGSVHLNWMRMAMIMAEEALAAGEVPVGCVFVRNGEAIAKARNGTNEPRNASRHAELEAIDLILANNDGGNRYPLSDTNLLFCGCENDKFEGCGSVLGVNAPSEHSIHPAYDAIGGYLREEAIMVLRRFYVTQNATGSSFLCKM